MMNEVYNYKISKLIYNDLSIQLQDKVGYMVTR